MSRHSGQGLREDVVRQYKKQNTNLLSTTDVSDEASQNTMMPAKQLPLEDDFFSLEM